MTRLPKDNAEWSAEHVIRLNEERRSGAERRLLSGQTITVPDMRANYDPRSGNERRGKVKLTITGRAINI